jgi:hypothetical protein
MSTSSTDLLIGHRGAGMGAPTRRSTSDRRARLMSDPLRPPIEIAVSDIAVTILDTWAKSGF